MHDSDFGLDWRIVTLQDVRDWLKSTGDVNVKDSDGNTPLHLAAWNNENPAIVSALIDAGADLEVEDRYGDTPLHTTVWNDNPAIISALIDAGQMWFSKSVREKPTYLTFHQTDRKKVCEHDN